MRAGSDFDYDLYYSLERDDNESVKDWVLSLIERNIIETTERIKEKCTKLGNKF